MKTILFLLFCLATIANAAPKWIETPGEQAYALHVPAVKIPSITLLDNREFKDCSVSKETYASISFRHAKGMMKVEKRLLPPDVLALFPLDEAKEKAEIAANAAGLKIYEEQKAKVAAQRDAEIRLQMVKLEEKKAKRLAAAEARQERGQAAVADAVAQKQTDAAIAQALGPDSPRLVAAVRNRAESYYGDGRRNGSGISLVFGMRFELEDPRPIPGWTGQYEIEGTVSYNFYDSIYGGTFSSASSNFTCTVEQKENGSVKVLSFSRKS